MVLSTPHTSSATVALATSNTFSATGLTPHTSSAYALTRSTPHASHTHPVVLFTPCDAIHATLPLHINGGLSSRGAIHATLPLHINGGLCSRGAIHHTHVPLLFTPHLRLKGGVAEPPGTVKASWTHCLRSTCRCLKLIILPFTRYRSCFLHLSGTALCFISFSIVFFIC
jgi:hypothetical protein